jgi:hypothetical protein
MAVEPGAETAEAATTAATPSALARDPAPARRSWWSRRSSRSSWSWPPHPALGITGLTGVLAIPIVVALAELRNPRWFPLIDMAHMELFIRDVPTSDRPLVGAIGRMYAYGATGNHPGPITFYLLWPFYQLFGADGWSLQVGMGVMALVASGLAIWLGYRRGGWPLAVAVTAMLALLMRGYGATLLLEIWNPHLPLIWWVVFLLAVWSVLCHDLKVLPVAVLAGSICAQNHISYTPLVAGMAAVLTVVLGTRAYRTYRTRRPDGTGSWRRMVVWVGASLALLLVLWLPPLVEQVTSSPGNLSIILASFRDPQDIRLPAGNLARAWLSHLDAPDMFRAEGLKPAWPDAGVSFNWVGVLVLAVWAGAVTVAWRRRDLTLLRLHLVAAAAGALGLLSFTRLVGPPWPYLFYWAWGSTAVLLLATVWTFVSTVPRGSATGPGGTPALRWPRPTLAAAGAAALVLVVLFSFDARHAEMDDESLSQAVGQLTQPTVAALADDPACGDDCRVLVRWTDPVGIGAPGVGMVAALEREGIAAEGLANLEPYIGDHRVIRLADADVEVHVVVSAEAIAEWRERDDAELVAESSPYEPAGEPLAAFLVDLGQGGS